MSENQRTKCVHTQNCSRRSLSSTDLLNFILLFSLGVEVVLLPRVVDRDLFKMYKRALEYCLAPMQLNLWTCENPGKIRTYVSVPPNSIIVSLDLQLARIQSFWNKRQRYIFTHFQKFPTAQDNTIMSLQYVHTIVKLQSACLPPIEWCSENPVSLVVDTFKYVRFVITHIHNGVAELTTKGRHVVIWLQACQQRQTAYKPAGVWGGTWYQFAHRIQAWDSRWLRP